MAFFDLKPSSSCSSWDWESSSGVYSQPRGGVLAGGGGGSGGGGFGGFPWSSSQSDDLQSNNGGDGFLALAALDRPSAEEFCRNESSSIVKPEQEGRRGGEDEQERDPLSVCLKLGGKSSSGGGGATFAFSEEASSTPALSSSNNNVGRKEEVASLSPSLSPSSSMHLPPAKKARSGSGSALIPRCQVEGCRADLSLAKEYHRRHKVCGLHSKATSVIVAGSEQRFCQQCSRFHFLAEFDDGKRSCRKRLAGHNERRRKPQPDPLMYSPFFKVGSTGLPFLSSSSSSSSLSFSWDDKFNFRPPGGHEIWSRMHNSDSGNRHQSMINFSSESSWMDQSHSPPSFLPNCSRKINNHNDDGNGGVEPPLLLLPSTKESAPSNNGILLGQYLRHPYPTTSQGLTLSFSGGAEMHSGMEVLTRASDTVCALSLQHPPRSKDSFQQSNSSNNNNNSNSTHHLAIDPLLLHEASQGSSICPSEQSPLIVPSLPFDLAIRGGGKINNNNILSSTSSSSSSFHLDSSVSTTLGLLNNQGGGNSSIRDFDGGNPFFSMHGNGIGGDDNRPTTIDLMRLSSSSYSAFCPESNSMAQMAASQFGEFQALHHSYESSLFDPQQFM